MPPDYPATRTVDVVERHGGRDVADPYRWLEELAEPEVQAWMDAQAALAEGWLGEVDARGAIRARLDALSDHEQRGVPWRRGGRWFQLRNAGLAPQAALWVAEDPDAEGRVLLDPSDWSADGTTALGPVAVADDGATVAYAVAERGSDWLRWRFRDVDSGRELPDELRWSKFTAAVWHPDGSGIYYGAYPAPEPGREYEEATSGQRLAFHRLGTPQDDDDVVFAREDERWIFQPSVTDDGRWLVVTQHRGTDPRTRVAVADLTGDGRLRPLLDDGEAAYELAGSVGTDLLFLTDDEAPLGRVVAVPAAGGQPREVLAEGGATLERARVAGDRLLVVALVDATHRVWRCGLDGTPDGEVDLGALASVRGLSGRAGDDVVHLSVERFTQPASVLRHDLAERRTTEVFRPATAHDPDALVARQAFAESADGTRVPLFVVHRRDLAPAVDGPGAHPTLLWGYGGFRIPVTPTHRAHWTAWIEAGGVLAVANLRGGGEYGAAWHDAGRRANKTNVFDDALACADWLTDAGWTRPDRLAIKGRSNGGLLAAACLSRAPERFGAAVVEVGVLDMLRFHRSTIGWAWTSDYGDPDDEADAAALLAYSPYHNLERGRSYPATLVTTGDHDDRVVPWHSLKFTAALQAAQGGDAPVLLRVDRSGGHGAGKPTAKRLDERADVLAFLTRALDAGGLAWPRQEDDG